MYMLTIQLSNIFVGKVQGQVAKSLFVSLSSMPKFLFTVHETCPHLVSYHLFANLINVGCILS